MRKSLSALLAALVMATPVALFGATPAQATDGCVNQNEFRRVSQGKKLVWVEARFDTHGRVEYQGGGYKTKSYRACWGADKARVWVEYRHYNDAWRLSYKWYVNPENS